IARHSVLLSFDPAPATAMAGQTGPAIPGMAGLRRAGACRPRSGTPGAAGEPVAVGGRAAPRLGVYERPAANPAVEPGCAGRTLRNPGCRGKPGGLGVPGGRPGVRNRRLRRYLFRPDRPPDFAKPAKVGG